MKATLFFLLPSLAFAASEPKPDAEASAEKEAPTGSSGHVFAWPFMEWEEMKPRGGNTQGSDVTLLDEPEQRYLDIRAEGLSKKERDRRAILALAGDYRVSFDFVETLGVEADYSPPQPYFSWATEHVEVLEDRSDLISLQHVLVMYFQQESGETSGPHVMKHWRQDWTWEDDTIFTYVGNRTWEKRDAPRPEGRWSQAVWQVDDSPRYEVMGRWSHEGGLSTWRSDEAPRPIPRREFSVRNDYNVLTGHHQITLSPTGWIHVQNNRKLEIEDDGSRHYLATEIGVNRYQEITEPKLAPAFAESWEKVAPYWSTVRETWNEIQNNRDSIQLRANVDGDILWRAHFERASAIAEEGADPEADAEHARSTIQSFLKDEE